MLKPGATSAWSTSPAGKKDEAGSSFDQCHFLNAGLRPKYDRLARQFGHELGINQQLREQTPEETQAASGEFFRKAGQ